jgi:succinate dehydrogenase / fumarate reductase iron-sulfur subunit
MSNITLRIFRHNPTEASPASYQNYSVQTKTGETLLDVLERIREEQDPSLNFRRSCRHGVCGSCSLLVDSKPLQSCKTSVDSLQLKDGTSLLIEPLDKDHILRDLVPDDSGFWKALESVKPFVVAQPQEHASVPPASLRTDCIHCGACQALCPVVKYGEKFLGPAALFKLWRLYEDPRDMLNLVRLRTAAKQKSGAFDCARCLVCIEVCPRNLKPYEKISALQTAVLAAKETKNIPGSRARHSAGFRFTVLWTGLINEALLGLIILGPVMFRMMPRALKMLVHGKLDFRIFHREVRDSARLRRMNGTKKSGGSK